MKKIFLKETDNKMLVYIAIALGIFFILSQFHDWANSLSIKLHFCNHTACIVYSLIWMAFGVIGLNKIRKKERIGKINVLPYIVILIVGIVLMNITYCDAEGNMRFKEGFAFLYPKENITESIPVPIPPCMETDDGRDYITFGEIRSGADVPDRCMGADILRERYCNSELTYTSEDISCSDELGSYRCEEGECVYFEPIVCADDTDCEIGYICIGEECVIEWTETDDGYDPDEYGECIHSRDDSLSVEDYCIDDETLMEYWIESYELVSEELTCEGICVAGRCVETGCTETDDGYDVGTFGIITHDGIDYSDFCEEDGDLTEYACGADLMYFYANIDCGAIELYDLCFGGECVAGEGELENTDALCDDDRDNDGDLATDCADTDCIEFCECSHRGIFPDCLGYCDEIDSSCTPMYTSETDGECACMPNTETACRGSEHDEQGMPILCRGWCVYDMHCIHAEGECYCSSFPCLDTDSGYDIETAGDCIGIDVWFTDHCVNNVLHEYQCLGSCMEFEQDCETLWGENGICETGEDGGYCIELT